MDNSWTTLKLLRGTDILVIVEAPVDKSGIVYTVDTKGKRQTQALPVCARGLGGKH